jgi:hypothetical protein
MESFVAFLGTPLGFVCACLAGFVSVGLLIFFLHYRLALRKWESDTAAKLIAAGVPTWATDELTKASQGDLIGAASAAKNAVNMLQTAAGLGDLVAGIMISAKNDPVRWARVVTVYNDLTNGASAAQLKADLTTAFSGSPAGSISPLPTLKSVAHADIQSAVQNVQNAITTASTLGQPVLAHIADTLSAVGQANIFPLVAAGAQAHAAQVAIDTPPADAATLQPAAGLTVTASNALPGHSIAVTAQPGSPAANSTP